MLLMTLKALGLKSPLHVQVAQLTSGRSEAVLSKNQAHQVNSFQGRAVAKELMDLKFYTPFNSKRAYRPEIEYILTAQELIDLTRHF
jgi:hypothetical protein